MNSQLNILNIMALFTNHATHNTVDIVSQLAIVLLGVLIQLPTLLAGMVVVVDTCVMMNLNLVTIATRMNLTGLSIAPSSLKRAEQGVKSLFLCGVETVKRRDAATARNARVNGSQSAHRAL